jgi:hypothetical protein
MTYEVPEAVWDAAAEVASLWRVVQAIKSENAAWDVTTLIEETIRAVAPLIAGDAAPGGTEYVYRVVDEETGVPVNTRKGQNCYIKASAAKAAVTLKNRDEDYRLRFHSWASEIPRTHYRVQRARVEWEDIDNG